MKQPATKKSETKKPFKPSLISIFKITLENGRTFPDEFWIKLIKVKGYPSYMALKRPSFVGHWVNDIIYDRIKPGIRKKLNELNRDCLKPDGAKDKYAILHRRLRLRPN
ncbi:MAG: hypothetical protein IPO55_01515 [Alphaproteobacteria bacterium]|nr:hypothetical protein [Alphaproteobacteria bacterium]